MYLMFIHVYNCYSHGTYIMDPCNPTNDLYNLHHWNWDAVAQEARHWLQQPMFQCVSGTSSRW